MSNTKTWQGSYDALCGIYCASHLISCFKGVVDGVRGNQAEVYEERAQEAFRLLLHSTESLGYLTASKLALGRASSGFTDRQLERVFNNLSEKDRVGLSAIAFSRPKVAALKNSERRALISNGSCAIIHEHGRDHWITVDGLHRDGGYHCFDPDPRDNTRRREKIRWGEGLFVGFTADWNF